MYTACIIACGTADFLCLGDCARDFDLNVLDCPCRKNCPNGCPCDSYECPQTTTETTLTTTTVAPYTTVLILNTAFDYNVPVLTDSSGRVDTDLAFTFDENTSVRYSCSVTFKNQHFVYGGFGVYKRQISRIEGCQLRRIRDLPFDHERASCAAVGDDRIYLCFNLNSADHKKCRYAPGPEGPFYDAPLSNYDHEDARIAASPSNITGSIR